MNQQQYSQFKEWLLQMRAHSNGKLASAEYPADVARNSRTESCSSSVVAIPHSVAAQQTHLAAIEHALERIEEGTYGCCLACNRPIGMLQLFTNPCVTECERCSG